DGAIAGHLFCSFLALLLRKELDERLAAANVSAEWGDVVRDLDGVEQVTVEQGGKRFRLRPQAPGCAGGVFKAVGVALPPLLQQLPNATPPPAAAAAPPRATTAWCHAPLNFPDSHSESTTSRFAVFNFSLVRARLRSGDAIALRETSGF